MSQSILLECLCNWYIVWACRVFRVSEKFCSLPSRIIDTCYQQVENIFFHNTDRYAFNFFKIFLLQIFLHKLIYSSLLNSEKKIPAPVLVSTFISHYYFWSPFLNHCQHGQCQNFKRWKIIEDETVAVVIMFLLRKSNSTHRLWEKEFKSFDILINSELIYSCYTLLHTVLNKKSLWC